VFWGGITGQENLSMEYDVWLSGRGGGVIDIPASSMHAASVRVSVTATLHGEDLDPIANPVDLSGDYNLEYTIKYRDTPL
jgi:hypothetical protein